MAKRQILSISINDEVAEKLKNVVCSAPGWTMGELITALLNKFITEVEKERGEPFPDRGDAMMRKGTQRYINRTQLLDLSDWVVG